jgi:hypothetical protein
MKASHVIPALAALPLLARAATTIDPAHKYGWAGNIGWLNWGDAGVSVGSYVCSGYIWSANCGWIHLGGGAPANGIRYTNTSASDYGVNALEPASVTLVAKLRGYAYGANIGWIHFEDSGNPEISFVSGNLSGSAWSANCGWINLSDATAFIRSTTIDPGPDSDDDGIADPFEYEATDGCLTVLTATGDHDNDGQTDVSEYLAGTNPTSSASLFHVTSFTGENGTFTLTWTSPSARLYRICRSDALFPDAWVTLVEDVPPAGESTDRTFEDTAAQRFFRVEAYLPLVP